MLQTISSLLSISGRQAQKRSALPLEVSASDPSGAPLVQTDAGGDQAADVSANSHIPIFQLMLGFMLSPQSAASLRDLPAEASAAPDAEAMILPFPLEQNEECASGAFGRDAAPSLLPLAPGVGQMPQMPGALHLYMPVQAEPEAVAEAGSAMAGESAAKKDGVPQSDEKAGGEKDAQPMPALPETGTKDLLWVAQENAPLTPPAGEANAAASLMTAAAAPEPGRETILAPAQAMKNDAEAAPGTPVIPISEWRSAAPFEGEGMKSAAGKDAPIAPGDAIKGVTEKSAPIFGREAVKSAPEKEEPVLRTPSMDRVLHAAAQRAFGAVPAMAEVSAPGKEEGAQPPRAPAADDVRGSLRPDIPTATQTQSPGASVDPIALAQAPELFVQIHEAAATPSEPVTQKNAPKMFGSSMPAPPHAADGGQRERGGENIQSDALTLRAEEEVVPAPMRAGSVKAEEPEAKAQSALMQHEPSSAAAHAENTAAAEIRVLKPSDLLVQRADAAAATGGVQASHPSSVNATAAQSPAQGPELTPRLKEEVFDKVFREVSSIRHTPASVDVTLSPESLGKVTVNVGMEEGKMSARINVQNADVRQIIEAGMPRLQDALRSSGVTLDSIAVFIDQGSSFAERRNDAPRRKMHGGGGAYADDGALDALSAAGEGKQYGYSTVEYIM